MPTHTNMFIPGEMPQSGEPRPVDPRRYRDASLRGILDNRFSGELDRLEESQPDLETRFLEALRSPVNFADFRGELTEFAKSVTADVFGPGGQVQGAMTAANEGVVGRGLDPFGGTAARSRNDILRGATGAVSNAIGQQATQIAGIASQQRGNDLAQLLGFTQFQGARGDSLRESLFGGQATIENLNLARDSFDLNERMVEQALRERRGGGGFWGKLGGIAGGLLGSALGPAGSAVGSALGGKAVDWLGLGSSAPTK